MVKLEEIAQVDLSGFGKSVAQKVTELATTVETNRIEAERLSAAAVSTASAEILKAKGLEEVINKGISDVAETGLNAANKVIISLRTDIDAANEALNKKADVTVLTQEFEKLNGSLISKVDSADYNGLKERVEVAEKDVNEIAEVSNRNVRRTNEAFASLGLETTKA
jgi:hypothetical protein